MRCRRWFGRLLVVALLGGTGVLVSAAPAAAAGQLVSSTPANDSTIDAPLQFLELYFTEKPTSNAFFSVTTPSGARVERPWFHGPPKPLDKPVQEYYFEDGKWESRLYETGFPAIVPVAHWPEQGQYVVRFVSVASDSEAVRGEVKFTYNGPTSTPPADFRPQKSEPDPNLIAVGRTDLPSAPPTGAGPNTPAAVGEDHGPGLWVWLVPVLLLAGAVTLSVLTGRPRALWRRILRPSQRPNRRPAPNESRR